MLVGHAAVDRSLGHFAQVSVKCFVLDKLAPREKPNYNTNPRWLSRNDHAVE